MPLRDHFRPPLDDRTSWDGFHGQWPAMIVMELAERLPRRYVAAPHVHLGSSIEIDVAAYDVDDEDSPSAGMGDEVGGASTAVWAPPAPNLAVVTGPPDQDEYEVRIYEARRARRLVAAIEIVSPSNKDRPEHRRAFVAKCAGLLKAGVGVAIVDLVTTRSFNLHGELLEFLGQDDPSLADGAPPIYAAACRWPKRGDDWVLESWSHPLALGQPLPTLPLWIGGDFAMPLDLESSYEATCRVLRIS